MRIDDMQEFRESQLTKAERRKEEDKRIRKGVYQMQVLIDYQQEEILNKEYEKSRERAKERADEDQETETEPQRQERKKADVHDVMQKMMSVASPLKLGE